LGRARISAFASPVIPDRGRPRGAECAHGDARFARDRGDRIGILVFWTVGIAAQLDDGLVSIVRYIEHAAVGQLLPHVLKRDLKLMKIVKGRDIGGARLELQIADVTLDTFKCGGGSEAGEQLLFRRRERI
jgi:hypothetical protein